MISPIAIGSAFFLLVVFSLILVSWCCHKWGHRKTTEITTASYVVPDSPFTVPSVPYSEHIVPYPMPCAVPVHRGRYIATTDVRTGLPVVIDIATLAYMESHTINARRNSSQYGTMNQGLHYQAVEGGQPRTPPPAYSEFYSQPKVGNIHE